MWTFHIRRTRLAVLIDGKKVVGTPLYGCEFDKVRIDVPGAKYRIYQPGESQRSTLFSTGSVRSGNGSLHDTRGVVVIIEENLEE